MLGTICLWETWKYINKSVEIITIRLFLLFCSTVSITAVWTIIAQAVKFILGGDA